MTSFSDFLRPNLCHITVDTEGLFHHDRRGLDRGPFRSLAEALAALRGGSRRLPYGICAEAYGKLFPLVRESLLPRSRRSGWEYHLTLKGGLFDVHLPDIGGPFQGLGEALAAVERHRASLTPAPAIAKASLALAPVAEPSLALAPAAEPHSVALASAAEPPSLALVYAAETSLALAPAAEASLSPPPAAEASLAPAPAVAEASLAPPPAAEPSLAPPPAAEGSFAPPPAAQAPLAPAPGAEASSNPPPPMRRTGEKKNERNVAHSSYICKRTCLSHQFYFIPSQLDPDECLQSVKSTLEMMENHAQKDAMSAKQSVEKSWMDTVIEKFTPTTTDPDILKACYRFERLLEKREAIKNGMKWMRKEVLQAFKSYISSAGYNKDFEYDFVRLDFQCLIYGTSSKSYHHYNFTMRTRLSRRKPWTYQRYFAEVKPTDNGTEYFCCPLQPSEDGHCFGCRKVGISLRHPESGGYEKGHPGSGFPFDTDSESDD